MTEDGVISMGALINTNDIFLFSLCLILGFASAKFLTGRTPQIKFLIFHIHHWIWATTILVILFIIGQTPIWVVGILTGVALEGLTYDDWSLFIKKE
jgi:hypothetical protein